MRPLIHILDTVYNQPWCILPSKHRAIQAVIEAHLSKKADLDFGDIEPPEKEPFAVVGKTAVIPIEGVILNKCSGLEAMCGAQSLQDLKASIGEVSSRPDISNVIFNISSGGGTVTGVPEAADAIAQLGKSKDTYAYTDDCIASAAYWLASQTKGIFLSKSAEIGSIGVYLALIDSSKAMADDGLKLELFKAGAFKAMGIPGTTLTDDQRTLLQSSVDKIYGQFTSYVLSTRPRVPVSAMQGQMFDSKDSLKNGLADGVINSLDSLVDLLNSR